MNKQLLANWMKCRKVHRIFESVRDCMDEQRKSATTASGESERWKMSTRSKNVCFTHVLTACSYIVAVHFG